MSAQEDVTTASIAMFDTLRELRGPSGSLKVLSGPQHATTEATYTDGWDFPRKEHLDVTTNKQYRRLLIADPDGTRKTKLVAATALKVGSVIYKNAAKDPNLALPGIVPVYEFRVYGTGERV